MKSGSTNAIMRGLKQMSKKKVTRPNRDPDHYSKRMVPYWWSPEWIRGTAADVVYDRPIHKDVIPMADGTFCAPTPNYGRIHAVKEKNDVNLYMKSKEGKLTYIQGSIQKEFKKWHLDREIDYILLGLNPDDILQNETE
jgi:hypothetical protein